MGLAESIRETYQRAAKEVDKKTKDFWARHKAKAEKKLQDVANGKISMDDYKRWLSGQVFIGERWKEKLDDITRTYVEADEKARETINKTDKNVFVRFANAQGRDIKSHIAGYSFDLYDKHTVERLLKEDPKMLPEWKINEPKDYTWNEKRVKNEIMQGIIQGEDIPSIAKRLSSGLATSNHKKMNMFARTAVTGAQNAGRMQMLHDAQEKGVVVKKKWLATMDRRTRDVHRDELNGVEVDVDEPFHTSLGDIMFPGDPNADPANTYNCRCTLVYVYDVKASRENLQEREEAEEKEPAQTTVAHWPQAKQEDIRETVSRYNADITKKNDYIKRLEEEYQGLVGESVFSFGTDKYHDIERRIGEIEAEISRQYKDTDGIRDELRKYLSTADEQAISNAFGEIVGNHDIMKDANSVNRITGDMRTQLNCSSCCLAYDVRRRGIDCKAILMYGNNDNQVEEWFDGLRFATATSYSPHNVKQEIIEAAEQWGIGARGIVAVDYTATSGHYFMFEVDRNGKCIFIDPQTGSTDCVIYFEDAIQGGVRFGRTDDKKLTRGALLSLDKGGIDDGD